MIKSNKVQSDESLLTQDEGSSYHTQDTEYIDYRQRSIFQFGSSVLAVIYMANTMVIPNMNQLYSEISFQSTQSIVYSVTLYWALMLIILIPCYLVIRVCREESNPIFANIVKQESKYLYYIFIYANLTINVVGLFNIVVRLGENLPKVSPYLWSAYNDGMKSEDEFVFYKTCTLYTIGILLLFYANYRISYLERFHDIQYRLLFSFIGKWVVSSTIFFFIFFADMKSQCNYNYLSIDENLLTNFEFNLEKVTKYFFNIFCCMSYPFFEVFYLKRETKSGYTNVQHCYWYQLLLRSIFFFSQVITWYINYDKLQCFYQPILQSLNCLLIVLVVISIGPIYAHNYTLNKEILKENVYVATREENQREIKEIYIVSAMAFMGLIGLVIILRYVFNTFCKVQDHVFNITYSVHTICFSYCCIALPIYIFIKKLNHKNRMVTQIVALSQLILFMSAFLLISICPIIY